MPRERIKILLADDDSEDLELIEEHILMVEPVAQLHKFTDGSSAYAYLSSQADGELPSLIILDYNMPGLNGAELLAKLKKSGRYASVPKIILSTSNVAQYIEESLNNGATEYIVKPHSMKEMTELAKKFVALAMQINHSIGR